MKRGKVEEKIMGPMFPRLHVNDTEKGGPRAPPRNKMALYEQLSIPSHQRFNPGGLPLNPNNATNLVPLASSSQGSGHERGMLLPLQLPSSMNPAEKPHTRYADLNAPLVQLEQQKNLEEDDFRVPIFVQSRMGQGHCKNYNSMDKEKLSPFSPAHSSRLLKLQNASEKEPNRTDTVGLNLRQAVRSQTQENSNECVSRREPSVSESCEDQSCRSLQGGNADRGDDSETSIMDSISCMDISPDDVVGIIGQKHFLKARRAIVNQQRVFAVQVFELHRLIKVQRLIAESPHLLVEENAYLGKPFNGSLAKKMPLEYNVKAPPIIAKHKDDSEKPNHKMECSAENAVGKVSLSSVENVTQPSNYGPFSGTALPTSGTTDAKMGSWSFHQPPGHQWLIPVMSPSEGLVYKPYPGPEFVGPVYGGFGPPGPGSTPMMGNFLNPAYGVPASHHHYEGLGVAPFTTPAGHGYFPPYGMPVMNPALSGSVGEQMHHFAGLHGQLSGGGASFNMQYQSSCNMPSQKSGAVSNVVKLNASKDSEIQASTASSPSERAQETKVGNTTGGRNALSLFPTSPAVCVPDGVSHPHDADLPARVIRVVPHNARSATESVARIFQSIQEERKL